MPSVPIARRVSPSRRRRIRAWCGYVTLVLLTLVLAACSSGSARESERAQERDATAEAVIPNRQATYSATFVVQPTPTKIPPRPPRIAALVLTTQANSDGSPNGEYASVPSNAGTVFLSAQLSGVRKGTMAAALRDTTDQHNVLVYNQIEIGADADSAWVAIPLQMDGMLAPGDYPIWLIFDPGGEEEEWIGSLVVTVSSAGSGARQVGEGRGFEQRDVGGEDLDPLDPGNEPERDEADEDGGEEGEGGDSPPIQPRESDG